MTSPQAWSRSAEWCCALFTLLVLNLAYAGSQPVNTFLVSNAHEALGADGQVYHSMASQLPRELPPQAVAPFVYRLGVPLLAAGVAKSQDWVLSAGFDRINLAFNALSVILLLLLLQRHVASAFVRLLVVIAFMIEPHSPVRLSYFQPLSVEPAMLTGLLAGLLGIGWFHSRPGPARAAVVAAIVAAGVVVHEALAVIGVCMLFPAATTPASDAPRSRWRSTLEGLDRSGAWLPLVAGVAMLGALHAWVVASPSEYSAWDDASRGLFEKSLLGYGVAWFLVFGPVLAVPIYFWRRSAAFLRDQPALLIYLAIFAVAAWVGDGDTERFLVLASPVIYILIGRSLTESTVRPAAVATASLVLVQALSSRVFSPIGGPIAPPQIGVDVWERLGWAGAAWTLSYDNMWSQLCAPPVMGAYVIWYGLTAGSVLAYLHLGGSEKPSLPPGREAFSRSATRTLRATRWPKWMTGLVTAVVTLVALSPVAWLSLSRFYWQHYDQPGYAYVAYNLARLWTLALLLAVFWATGSRILRHGTAAAKANHWTDRFFDAALCGAAVWAVGVVLLAAVHLYYTWVILPLVGIGVFVAITQILADRRLTPVEPEPAPFRTPWGLVGLLLRLSIVVLAGGLLLTIALWGNVGPDNDVPGNYLPYYEAVLRAHSIAPNGYWVHYFVSKGHGLAFLFNILSDVQGASLASWLVLMLGAGMIWRLARPHGSGGEAIGLVGVCLYLQFFAEQGAYAKGHIVRNILILYLILAFARSQYFRIADSTRDTLGRLVVITAVILLSPLAIVLLLPIFFMEAGLRAVGGSMRDARRSLIHPAWAVTATAVACGYNFVDVGVPELHNMPSAVGRVVDFERLSQWLDPRLAFVDYRLGFLQLAVAQDAPVAPSAVRLPETIPVMQVLAGVLNVPAMIWLGSAVLCGVIAAAFLRGRRLSSAALGAGPAAAALYLLACLVMVAVLRMFGGGAGSSMARFTDFTTPLGIALGVVILTAIWTSPMTRLARGVLGAVLSGVACVALYLGSAPIMAQLWRPSVGFFLGQNTYASMYDPNWDTVAARRMALALPENEKAELLNFLPGFTAVPATPFQRPDGGAYIRNYTAILYGSEEQAAETYRASGVSYFLVDLSDSDVAVGGFSPLFAPESIRSRMRLVRHDRTERRDLYLLTWKGDQPPAEDELFEAFLQKWSARLAVEQETGTYHWAYDEGARRIGRGR